jgi:hypothetical protein
MPEKESPPSSKAISKRHVLVQYIEHTLLDEKFEQLRMFDSELGYPRM